MVGPSSSRTRFAVLIDVWRDYLGFLGRPRIGDRLPLLSREGERVWLAMLLLDLLLVAGVSAILAQVEAGGIRLPQLDDDGLSFPELLFWAVLIAPPLEEMLFRSWLGGRRLWFAALGYVLGLLVFLVLLRVLAGPVGGSVLATVAIAWLAFAFHRLWARREDRREVPGFRRYFALIFWTCALLFAGLHSFNYKDPSDPLVALMLLPQVIGGTTLAYVRLRCGLPAAIGLHAAYNLFWSAFDSLPF